MSSQTEHSAQSSSFSAATPAFSTAQRKQLRKEALARRKALPAAQRQAAEQAIEHLLFDWLQARPWRHLGFCWPIQGEVDLMPLAHRLDQAGWRLAMPVVVERDAPMSCRPWSPAAPMTQDPYGIPVPACTDPVIPEVLLLPLVAFDSAGFRLGYGGGYFDRSLAAWRPRPITIGVGFECGRLETVFPQAHDIALDYWVTEKGLGGFRSAG